MLQYAYFSFFIFLTFFSTNTKNVELRKFPYPYKAAFTICSDIDDTESAGEFVYMHRFMNSRIYGLDLEIGDTFWMYNEQIELLKDSTYDIHSFHDKFSSSVPALGISYYDGTSTVPSLSKNVISDYIKGGYIDCLHSYGNFSSHSFKRSYAEKALLDLKANKLFVDVFITHGGHENSNNVGRWPWQRGDNPTLPEYHSDLTTNYGIKFFWTGQMTHCIGQNSNFSLETFLKTNVEWLQDCIINKGKPIYNHDNQLAHIVTLDDNRKVFEFVRYINRWGRYEITDEPSLLFQVNPKYIDILIDNEGYLIQYTHLGANYGFPFLSFPTVELLKYVKQKKENGELFITTTSRMLNYYVHHKYLHWHSEETDQSIKIIVDNISNEVEGTFIPTLKDLQGITFYVPDDKEVLLYIQDRKVDYIKNPRDYKNKTSISLPWNPLNFDKELSKHNTYADVFHAAR